MTSRSGMLVIKTSLVLAVAILLLAGFGVWCINMPGKSLAGDPPLLTGEQERTRKRLNDHVQILAGDIGKRNYQNMKELNRAADYIHEQLVSMGYVPAVHQFGDAFFRNIEIELHGIERHDEIIVIGAHYDTAWGTPGADDNASGVAGLLEIARKLYGERFRRTVRFIFFANEEEPFYGTEDMGSRVSARRARDRGENIIAMFSLEMIGYYSDGAGSQHYPDIIRPFYPERGNFIAFVSNLLSGPVTRRATGLFRKQQAFPAEGMIAPEWLVPDIRRSDNAAFWRFGYPAVMVTDTANYRNRNYHDRTDTPGTLDYTGMSRVVTGLTGMIRALAGEK